MLLCRAQHGMLPQGLLARPWAGSSSELHRARTAWHTGKHHMLCPSHFAQRVTQALLAAARAAAWKQASFRKACQLRGAARREAAGLSRQRPKCGCKAEGNGLPNAAPVGHSQQPADSSKGSSQMALLVTTTHEGHQSPLVWRKVPSTCHLTAICRGDSLTLRARQSWSCHPWPARILTVGGAAAIVCTL